MTYTVHTHRMLLSERVFLNIFDCQQLQSCCSYKLFLKFMRKILTVICFMMMYIAMTQETRVASALKELTLRKL